MHQVGDRHDPWFERVCHHPLRRPQQIRISPRQPRFVPCVQVVVPHCCSIAADVVPRRPSTGRRPIPLAIVDDGMGEFQINVSSIRQRFLEAFRLRSEQAASIDEDMREAIAGRLMEEYGSPKAGPSGPQRVIDGPGGRFGF